MDLFTIIFVLFLYYVRPHEWIDVFRVLPLFKLTFAAAMLALFQKHRGLRIKDILQSPQDWMMLFYFAWMIGSSPTPWATFKLVLPLYAFYYVVAVMTLDNPRRMQIFLNWWVVWIMVLTVLAISSKFGFDPVDSYGLTVGKMKGRLAFNTTIFNNANALGHSIVPVIVMLYFIGIWKRPVFIKIATGALLLIPIWCVWLTVSKGAFLTGFATVLVAVTFRRPIGVQLFIIVLALTLGVVAVQQLPRMEEITASKSDQAIQGRVAAFRFGMETMENKFSGVGWANFEIALFHRLHFQKAPHSSYVRVGGELGFPGLMLFVGIMYCCARTLLFAHTESDAEERLRRLMFVMLVSYAVSSWMVGWADRATFFLMVATISAFHRYLQNRETTEITETTEASSISVSAPELPQPLPLPALQPAAGTALTQDRQDRFGPLAPVAVPAGDILVQPALVQKYLERIAGIRWKRVGCVDWILIALVASATYVFWHFIMNRM